MGLIGAGLASGIGAGLSGMGAAFEKRDLAEETLREKLADRAAERESRAELQRQMIQQRADSARDNNDTRLLIAGSRGAGSGGGSTAGMNDFSPGSAGATALAGLTGLTEPELHALEQGLKTGDFSAFKKDVQAPDTAVENQAVAHDPNADAKDRRAAETITPGAKSQVLPPGFDEWRKTKAKEVEMAKRTLMAGGNADAVAKSFGDLAQSRLMQAAADAPTVEASRVPGEKLMNTDPKGGAFREGGGVVVNQATGANTMTGVGEARAERELSQAEKNDRGPAGGSADGTDPRAQRTAKDALSSAQRALQNERSAVAKLRALGSYRPEKGETPEQAKDRYAADLKALLARETNAQAMADRREQEYQNTLKPQGAAPAATPAPVGGPGTPKNPLDAPTDASKRAVGTVYKTPKGNLNWLGNGQWEQL